MKKLYLFLFTVMCVAFVSKADVTYKFHFTVEDPESVAIRICDYYDDSNVIQEFEVKEGLNDYEYTSTDGVNLIISAVEGKVLKIHKEDGSVNYDVTNNMLKLYLSSFDWGLGSGSEYTYTIKTFDEESFRSNSVKVTLDNPDGIRMTLRGGNVINAEQTEYEIPFNDVYEDMLTIRKANAEDLIYKITANGEEVTKQGLEYNIPLVDRSDVDDIKYITDIVITQDFPEDLMCTVKFVFTNGDPGCISSVTYDEIPVENFAAEEGFQVHPGKNLYVTFNRDDYKMVSYQKNDDDPYESSYISIVSQPISSDFTLTVTAEKYNVYNAILVIEDPATVKVETSSYPSTELELVAGENVVTFKDAMYANELKITARDGYEMARIYDATYDNEVTISTWGPTTTIYLKENSKFEISTNKIIRDKQLAFYVDDLSSLYYGVTFSRGGSSITAKAGYNLVDYRDADGSITINASYAESTSKYYLNDQLLDVTYFSYYTLSNPQDNDVIKLFYVPENAIEHTVTFDMVEGTLDGFEVKKDIVAAVDPTQPVSAVGKTQFTIAPVSREGSDLTVTVGEENVEAVDGVYTFETEGDTTVKVTKATSGIENIICGENGTADVYNLQGIRVARQAKAADVNALPAGIYVVNGQKVIVK